MKKAFTLTELILTVTIIGVIAALLIPSMIKQYRLRVLSTQLKQTYEQIENAVKTAMEEEHTSDFYQTTGGTTGNISTTGFADGPLYFLKNYFKVRNTCQYKWSLANASTTAAANYKNTTGSLVNDNTSRCLIFATSGSIGYWLYGYEGHCVELESGPVICMRHVGTDENTTRELLIDTNGAKSSPNLIGYDIFSLKIDSKGHVSDSVDLSTCPEEGLCCQHRGAALGALGTPLVNHVDKPKGCFNDVVNNNWKIID